MKCVDCQITLEEKQATICYKGEIPSYRCFECIKKRNQQILKEWVTELRKR